MTDEIETGPSCPKCGSDETGIIRRDADKLKVQCLECGLTFEDGEIE